MRPSGFSSVAAIVCARRALLWSAHFGFSALDRTQEAADLARDPTDNLVKSGSARSGPANPIVK